MRTLHAQRPPLVWVDAAGPCGSWRAGELTQPGDDGGVVAPALIPTQAGDRVTPARRDAVPWARLRRSGALPPGEVPQVADDAIRALSRARADALRALKTAPCRLNAVLLRQERRSTGQAPWRPAPLRWLAEVVCPTPAPPLLFQASVRAVPAPPARRQRGTAAPGRPHDSRPHAGPPGPHRRRVGRSRSGSGQSPPATAPGTPPERPPGQRWEGAGTPGSTVPATQGPRHPGNAGGGRQRPSTGGLQVGQRPAGPRDRLNPAPVWCRREAQQVCRPSAQAPPRGGVTLDRVKSPLGRRVPRARPAPDGGPYGGSPPTESRRLTRRLCRAPPLPMAHRKHWAPVMHTSTIGHTP